MRRKRPSGVQKIFPQSYRLNCRPPIPPRAPTTAAGVNTKGIAMVLRNAQHWSNRTCIARLDLLSKVKRRIDNATERIGDATWATSRCPIWGFVDWPYSLQLLARRTLRDHEMQTATRQTNYLDSQRTLSTRKYAKISSSQIVGAGPCGHTHVHLQQNYEPGHEFIKWARTRRRGPYALNSATCIIKATKCA